MKRIFVAAVAIVFVLSLLMMTVAVTDHQGQQRGTAIGDAAALLLAQNNNVSLNWAGYAVTGPNGSVTSVSASFGVPQVTPTPHQTTYVAVWAGIDGFSSGTVEQAGIMAESNHGGQVTYSAWTEFYPAAPTYAQKWTPSPGDTITVTVIVSNGNVNATVNDGIYSYSRNVASSGYDLNSAEWIVERPAIGGSLTNLANFGIASFTSDHATISTTSGTYSDQTIGFFSSVTGTAVNSISMESNKGVIIAYPSSLSSSGSSFTVTYGSPSNSGSGGGGGNGGGGGGGHGHGKP